MSNLFGNHIVGFPTRRLKYVGHVTTGIIQTGMHIKHEWGAFCSLVTMLGVWINHNNNVDEKMGVNNDSGRVHMADCMFQSPCCGSGTPDGAGVKI